METKAHSGSDNKRRREEGRNETTAHTHLDATNRLEFERATAALSKIIVPPKARPSRGGVDVDAKCPEKCTKKGSSVNCFHQLFIETTMT